MLAHNLGEFRELADNMDLIRIDQFIAHICRPCLSEQERAMLDEYLNALLEKNCLANYFLCVLNYKMVASGSSQLRLDDLSFVSLKDKFFKILSGSFVVIRYRLQ